MREQSLGGVVAVLVVLGSAGVGEAQNGGSLAELLPRLLSEAVTMPSTVGNVAGNPHEAHFLPAVAQLKAPYALNSALVSQLSTFPTGSSSGGFTYTLAESTGIPQRSSGNFGPAFAERALNIGKGKLSLGLNYQHVSFDQFEGIDLDGGGVFYLQHNDCCPLQTTDGRPHAGSTGPTVDANPFFEGDLVRATLALTAKTDTVSLFLNYGLSDSFDVGLAVPLVHVQLDASMRSEIVRLATASNTSIHNFGGSSPDARVVSESGSASGLGDIVFRSKWRFVKAEGGGLAAGLDVRLPTGDKDDLLGTGATQVKLSLYYSGDYGRFSPHLNVGYTFSEGKASDATGNFNLGDEVPTPIAGAPDAYSAVFDGRSPVSPLTDDDLDVPDEIDLRAGFAIQAHPRVTLNADLIGRGLRNVNRFGVVQKTFAYRTSATAPLQTATFDALDVIESQGTLKLLLGVAGVKINVGKTLLLNASVLFPLTSDGLRPQVTPVVGLDYAF